MSWLRVAYPAIESLTAALSTMWTKTNTSWMKTRWRICWTPWERTLASLMRVNSHSVAAAVVDEIHWTMAKLTRSIWLYNAWLILQMIRQHPTEIGNLVIGNKKLIGTITLPITIGNLRYSRIRVIVNVVGLITESRKSNLQLLYKKCWHHWKAISLH